MQSPDPLVITMQEWFSIFRQRVMRSTFLHARDNGLTMAQLGTLFHLSHKGACGVSDIGSELGVTNSAASQMLDRLVQLNLVTRSEDPKDRRVKQIVLTEKGYQILQESVNVHQEWLSDLVHSLSPDEREQVRATLVILIDKIHQVDSISN